MLYTDGVPDAKSPDGKRYTIERMLRVMNENSGMDPEKTVKSLKADIDSFQPADDPAV